MLESHSLVAKELEEPGADDVVVVVVVVGDALGDVAVDAVVDAAVDAAKEDEVDTWAVLRLDGEQQPQDAFAASAVATFSHSRNPPFCAINPS